MLMQNNQLGHMKKICKSRTNQQKGKAQVADQQQEEQLFMATCFTSIHASDCWLIDSGYPNHMTNDENLFKQLDKSSVSNVRIGNGEYIPIKRKGTVAIDGNSGIKLISDVLFVPEIDQNLLSVGQLLEKGYSVVFKDKHCLISDPARLEIFTIKMKGKRLFTRLDRRGVNCLFKHSKSDRIVAQEAGAFQSSNIGTYAEKKDGAKNAKPGRRNLSLYLLSIWQAKQTSIFSEQG